MICRYKIVLNVLRISDAWAHSMCGNRDSNVSGAEIAETYTSYKTCLECRTLNKPYCLGTVTAIA